MDSRVKNGAFLSHKKHAFLLLLYISCTIVCVWFQPDFLTVLPYPNFTLIEPFFLSWSRNENRNKRKSFFARRINDLLSWNDFLFHADVLGKREKVREISFYRRIFNFIVFVCPATHAVELPTIATSNSQKHSHYGKLIFLLISSFRPIKR